MKKSLVLLNILVLVGILILSKYNIKGNANIKQSVSQQDIQTNLKSLFGNQANNLKEIDKEKFSGMDIVHYKGENSQFDIDQNGDIVGYLNESINFYPKTEATIDQAKVNAKSFIKRICPNININNYKLEEEKLYDNGLVKQYMFRWIEYNENDVAEKILMISTNINGDIYMYNHFIKNLSVTKSKITVSKEEATEKAMNFMKTRLNSETLGKLHIIKAHKWEVNNTLYWIIQVEYPFGDPKRKMVESLPIFINAITGEIEPVPNQN